MDLTRDEAWQYPPEQIVVIGMITTAKDANFDEILSLTLLDGNGEVLFDELIKPVRNKKWRKQVTHLTYENVENAEIIGHYRSELKEYFDGSRLVVGYNLGAQLMALEVAGIHAHECPCFNIAAAYSHYQGQLSVFTQENRYVKLVDAAADYRVSENLRTTLGEAKAVRQIYYALMNDPKYDKFLKQVAKEKRLKEADDKTRVEGSQTAEEREALRKEMVIGGAAIIVLAFLMSRGCGAFPLPF